MTGVEERAVFDSFDWGLGGGFFGGDNLQEVEHLSGETLGMWQFAMRCSLYSSSKPSKYDKYLGNNESP